MAGGRTQITTVSGRVGSITAATPDLDDSSGRAGRSRVSRRSASACSPSEFNRRRESVGLRYQTGDYLCLSHVATRPRGASLPRR